MEPNQFGALALQLLGSAQIPGAALDQALAFRNIAEALAQGKWSLIETKSDERKPNTAE